MACDCIAKANAPLETDPVRTRIHRRTLWVALGLNFAMFVIGGIAGLLAHSSGLLADALDMLADAGAYGIALMAIQRGGLFKRRAAAVSGTALIALGIGVLLDVGRKVLGHIDPVSRIMMSIATLSLAVNAYVLYRLMSFRTGDVHLRAAWLFTRADVIASAVVIASGALVAWSGTHWPDLIAGTGIGLYVIKEGVEILRKASAA